MFSEFLTLQTLQSAQKIYILAFNAYVVYSYATSYYDTTRKVIRGCQTVYVVSSSLMNKMRQWRHTQNSNAKSKQAVTKQDDVELMDIKQGETPIIIKIPASLDDAVIDYFTVEV